MMIPLRLDRTLATFLAFSKISVPRTKCVAREKAFISKAFQKIELEDTA